MRDLASPSNTRRDIPRLGRQRHLGPTCVASTGRGSIVDISAAVLRQRATFLDARNDAVSLAPLLLTSIDYELDEGIHIDQVEADLTRLVYQFIVPLPMLRTRPSGA